VTRVAAVPVTPELERYMESLLPDRDPVLRHLEKEIEEIAELQMMYKNADLADKTRDIVLHRAERRLARQKEALALAKGDLDVLEQKTLPLERRRLELDLAARTAEAEDGARGAAIDEMNKRAALRDAEAEAAKAKAGGK